MLRSSKVWPRPFDGLNSKGFAVIHDSRLASSRLDRLGGGSAGTAGLGDWWQQWACEPHLRWTGRLGCAAHVGSVVGTEKVVVAHVGAGSGVVAGSAHG